MSTKQKRILWPLLVGFALALSVVGFATSRAVRVPASTAKDTQGLVIAIRPTGFVPAEVEIPDGRYVLVVQNRCGIRDLTFRLDRETGERLQEVRAQKLQWKAAFDLHPETYVLSVVDHPTWRCLIRVKAN